MRRLALAVLLQAVTDAKIRKGNVLPYYGTVEDVTEAIALSECPTFSFWCRLAQANPLVVARHLRQRLPVCDEYMAKVALTPRGRRATIEERSEHARRMAKAANDARWGRQAA